MPETMDAAQILYPMAALAGLTFAVLLRVPYVRWRAAYSGRVTARDFKLGESPNVPTDVALPNRNLMNLLELPVLFYVVCLALYATRSVDAASVWLAWLYVILRAGHSLVHLTYNNVFHRLAAYAASCVVLAAIWARWAAAVLA